MRADEITLSVGQVDKELDLDPKKVLPAEIYNAIASDGHVWALPYRVETFVLKCKADVLKKVGVEASFPTWESMLAAAEKLSFGAYRGIQISGFSPVRMPDEEFGGFLMSLALDISKGQSHVFA